MKPNEKAKIVWAKLIPAIPERVRDYCNQLVPEGDTTSEIISLEELQEHSTSCGNGDRMCFKREVVDFLKEYSMEPYVLAEVWKEDGAIAALAVRWKGTKREALKCSRRFEALIRENDGSLRAEESYDDHWDCFESE